MKDKNCLEEIIYNSSSKEKEVNVENIWLDRYPTQEEIKVLLQKEFNYLFFPESIIDLVDFGKRTTRVKKDDRVYVRVKKEDFEYFLLKQIYKDIPRKIASGSAHEYYAEKVLYFIKEKKAIPVSRATLEKFVNNNNREIRDRVAGPLFKLALLYQNAPEEVVKSVFSCVARKSFFFSFATEEKINYSDYYRHEAYLEHFLRNIEHLCLEEVLKLVEIYQEIPKPASERLFYIIASGDGTLDTKIFLDNVRVFGSKEFLEVINAYQNKPELEANPFFRDLRVVFHMYPGFRGDRPCLSAFVRLADAYKDKSKEVRDFIFDMIYSPLVHTRRFFNAVEKLSSKECLELVDTYQNKPKATIYAVLGLISDVAACGDEEDFSKVIELANLYKDAPSESIKTIFFSLQDKTYRWPHYDKNKITLLNEIEHYRRCILNEIEHYRRCIKTE